MTLPCVCSVVSTLHDSMDCSPPGSSPWDFSQQEYWSGLPFPTQGDLPNLGIKLASLAFAYTGRQILLLTTPPGKLTSLWTNKYMKE